MLFSYFANKQCLIYEHHLKYNRVYSKIFDAPRSGEKNFYKNENKKHQQEQSCLHLLNTTKRRNKESKNIEIRIFSKIS